MNLEERHFQFESKMQMQSIVTDMQHSTVQGMMQQGSLQQAATWITLVDA